MRIFVLAFTAILFAIPALATSFYERPFPEVVAGSPFLVRGKIGKSTVEWTTLSDGTKHLFTYTDLDVTEVVKGKLKTGPIRMRELGGEKDGVGLQISGAADFALGEDVVVLLDEPSEGAKDEAYPLQGMMMGKFTIEKGADGKEYLRGPALGSSVQPALRKNDHNHGGPQTQWSLDAVRELVRKQAEEKFESPRPTATPSARGGGVGLMSGRPLSPQATVESPDTSPANSRDTRRSPSGWVILIGVIAGVAFYVRTKRRRR